MINIKSKAEVEMMRAACEIVMGALTLAGTMVRPGIDTKSIDRKIREYIEKQGATPSFLGYNGFPASACISLNSEVIHGIPSEKVILHEGDLVKIDVGAIYKGWHGDCADSFFCGGETAAKPGAVDLYKAAREAFYAGTAAANPGNRIGDLSNAIQTRVEKSGFSVVRKWCGHGIGREMHEDPSVPNFGAAGKGVRLSAGMTLAVEPMINIGGHDVEVGEDEWTVYTADRSLSAHFERTVYIGENGCEVLAG